MRLLSNQWLAWTLRLVTEITLLLWLLLMGWVLVIITQQRLTEGGSRQGTVYTEVPLPTETAESTSAEVSVFNVEASQVRIHYRVSGPAELPALAGALAAVVVTWGAVAVILWLVRNVLSSFVSARPLTLDNARRFRWIAYLLGFHAVARAVLQSAEYLRLEQLFTFLPARGVWGLFTANLEWSRVFGALMILLLAEAVRLGAEHRIDSESVV